jgi:2-oxoglutarate dehydrogenase E2 component (dihydrolipoamide succinyltransferase)
MAIELKIPEVGESIREVQVGKWLKKPGDFVQRDEDVVEIETDKASVELPAPTAGVITEILKKSGEIVAVGEVVGYMEERQKESSDESKSPSPKASKSETKDSSPDATSSSESAETSRKSSSSEATARTASVMPAARRLLAEHDLQPRDVAPSGPGGRLLKEDVQRYVDESSAKSKSSGEQSSSPVKRDGSDGVAAKTESKSAAAKSSQKADQGTNLAAEPDLEEIVPMSLIRRRIAERLVEAQQQAALLTTFNEIDMTAVMALRSTYQDAFTKKHQIKLGFMSFFAKGIIEALKQVPELNAEIRENSIVYRNYYHLGIAIGGGKGLVVPILRHAERMSFAEIELAISDLGTRARENRIKPEELMGGTFTISNGGIYGSLLSTPIVNPPQSGVLGMHTIQERPVARNGQVVIRPMMYVALTYDHRIVDGQGAVTCLKRLKDVLEDPARMLIEI